MYVCTVEMEKEDERCVFAREAGGEPVGDFVFSFFFFFKLSLLSGSWRELVSFVLTLRPIFPSLLFILPTLTPQRLIKPIFGDGERK
jgi:hypothetical protein